MDERKEFRTWCESLTEADWLIAQSFEESFFLGAWAAWRRLRSALAAATERAEAAEARARNLEEHRNALAARLREVDDREHPR